MAEVSKLPGDGESVGVNQIRNKINEIIDEGVGGGGGSVIDVGDVGEFSSNLTNELIVSPPVGSNYNQTLRNAHPTYIPNGATEKLTDFPVHNRRITDDTCVGMFAILVNGKLYISTGNAGQHINVEMFASGLNSSARPGLENMREFHMGGYYQDKPDVSVLDFHLSITFCAVLMSDGILWGWGRQNQGQLAQGNTTNYNSPVIIDTDVTRMWGPRGVKQYQAGWNDYDGLYWKTSKDPYHTLRCAGYNGQGQLGDGTTITTGTAKPYVLLTYSHLHDFTSYRIKQVYNYSGVYGFIFIVLQHSTDLRVQQVVACGYNGYGNLGFDRYDSHTTFGPSKCAANSGFSEIHPSDTVNVSRLVWCKDVRNHPSWTPTWQCYYDSCAIEILGFYGGFHHGAVAATSSIHPWAACWSRVWTGYGQVQGDFLRTAGSNNYGMLGALDPGFGGTSVKNSSYKTYKYISHKSGGYTWDEALADAPNQLTGAKLAAPMTRADWNRLSVNVVENFSKPGAADLHHGWLALKDEEGEGWWKNHHTNKQSNRLFIPWSRPQADDSGTSRYLQGQAEYIYYNPDSIPVRSEDFTESRFTGSGETDGMIAANYLNNSGNNAGRGIHDMISIGRAETTTNNYTFFAETYSTSTTNPVFKTRVWRSTSTTTNPSFTSNVDINKFSVSDIHPMCTSNTGFKLHYVNPYVGKFVHLDDIGDLVYISWHHDNNQLICARTADLGGTWRYNYSDIEGAWGQRTSDAGYYVSNPGEHTDGGVTSAVYLGQGVIVAAFGGAYPNSGRGLAESNNSQALLVRSFDYGRNWHLIGDGDLDFTFSNLTSEADYASHFNVGRYYDVLSNKFRLICFAGSGGTTGQGYYNKDPYGWTFATGAFALAYSDDFGDTWNWCQIDGAEINYDLTDETAWPDKLNFRGDSLHFCMQQSKVYIVRTHFEKALETNNYGETRENWGEINNAWTYISSDGGRTFASTMPGYLTNLHNGDSDSGIVTENGVYNKGGGDLNKTGRPVETLLLGKAYRNIMKLEPYGTDGVMAFWQRNGDQEYQAPGYGDSSTFDNNTVEVANYKSMPIAGGDGIFEDWLLQDSNLANLETFSNKWNTTPKIKDFIGHATSYSMSDNGQRMILGFEDSIIPSIHRDPYTFTNYEGRMPAGVAIILQKNTSGGWTVMPTRVPNYHTDGISTGTNRYCLYANLEEYKTFIGDLASAYGEFNYYYRFGFDVSMSGDGNTVAISAPGHGLEDGPKGTIYTYRWNGSRWVGNRTNSMNSHYIGQQVKLNYDGTRLVSSVCGRANASEFSLFSNENYQAAQVCIADTNFWEWKQEANIGIDYDNWGNTSISTSHDSDTPQKMQYIAVGGFPTEFSWNAGHVSQGPVIYTGGWKHIYEFFNEPYTALDYDGEGDAITILKSWTVSEYTAKDFNQYGGETHRAPMNFVPPGWTEQSLYDFAQEFMADASHPDTGEIQSIDFIHLNTTRYHGFIRDRMNFAVNSYNGKIYDYTWEGMPPTTSGNNNVLETRFGSFLELNSTGDVMLVGAPLYRVINGDTPSRLITSTNLNKRLGAVYMFKWDSQWGREDVEIFYESSYGTYRSTSPMIGNWVNVMGDSGPLYVGDDLAGAYAGNNFGNRDIPSWMGVWDDQNSMGNPPLDKSENYYKRTPGWRKTFQFSNNGQKISIIDGHAKKVQIFTYDHNTNTVTKKGAINVASASGGASEPNGMGIDLKYGILEPNGQFMHTSLYATREGTTDYTAATFDTNLAEFAEPWQPEHRMTLIADIMTPENVRNAGNVVDYFINPYHYSWATNSTYKSIFNQGSYLVGAELANGDVNFIQGGYGNLNYGYAIPIQAKKFDPTWIGFGEGEQHMHVMAGAFIGYDGWRDLASGKASSDHYIFNAGGAMYPLANDIGGPSTTSYWGDYNGSTRYFGYWIEKEINIDNVNGTLYLARDGADGKPCVDVAIPEINRFTSPTVSSEYTNLVDDPVTQIRDIRVHASGPGGLIITLSNGKVWTTGYNGLSQRGNWSYTNEHDDTTNLDYPTMIPHPNKVDASLTWDKCMLAIAPYGTNDHYTSILMRDSENKMWGWGYNSHGELGLGHDSAQVKYPEQTVLPEGVFPSVMGQMSTTSNGPASIMITTEGKMYAAGYNGHNSIAEGEGGQSEYNIFIPIKNPLS